LNYVFFVIFSDFKVIFEVTGVIKNRSYSECKNEFPKVKMELWSGSGGTAYVHPQELDYWSG
jgi:hypothetical protein